jgi:oligopeptide/dipeptide ABC transporter ATP-binding protein
MFYLLKDFNVTRKKEITDKNECLLAVNSLSVYYNNVNSKNLFKAVDNVDLCVSSNETLGLVGESGCGKTTLALSILQITSRETRKFDGSVLWKGKNLFDLKQRELRSIRGKEISMIFQNPRGALNPVITVGKQIGAVLKLHWQMKTQETERKVIDLLRQVRIPNPESRIKEYPHQLSQGMNQRVLIAMAIACRPQLLIADEPTSSLDVTIQSQIMDLLIDIKKRLGMSLLLISHNLGVVATICDRVAVMYLGRIVELTTVKLLFDNPLHPYSQLLIRSLPTPSKTRKKSEPFVLKEEENSIDLTMGCRFRDRCPKVFELCRTKDPSLELKDSDHAVACLLYTKKKE